MFSSLLCKIASLIGVGLISCMGITQPQINMGAYNMTGGGTYRLQTSVGTTNTTIKLSSFKEPVSNIKYTMTYLNTDIIYGTIDPQSNYSEFISATGITQNSDGTASLTGVTRGLSRTPGTGGCVASTTLAQTHSGQSIFIISQSPCGYGEYAKTRGYTTFTGNVGFTNAPTSTDQCNAAGEFCDYTYVNSLAIAGGATSTEDTLGFVRIGTASQAAASTASSTSGAPLVLSPRYATSSPGTAGTYIPTTESDGKLNQSFLDLSDTFTFTAASTTVNRLLVQDQIQTGKLIASSTIRLGGNDLTFPSNKGASSTMLMTNGSGGLTWGNEGWGEIGEVIAPTASTSISIQNIPARKDLKVVISLIGQDVDDEAGLLRFNNDAGTNYRKDFYTNYTTASRASGTSIGLPYVASTTYPAMYLDIENTATQAKRIYANSVQGTDIISGTASWNDTSNAITKITMFMSSRSFDAGTRITIYGSRN